VQVVLHWRTGDVNATLLGVAPNRLTIDIEGEDAPFLFDAVADRWLERDWGGHEPIRITSADTGEPVAVGCEGEVG
jgi:hypothetical protein